MHRANARKYEHTAEQPWGGGAIIHTPIVATDRVNAQPRPVKSGSASLPYDMVTFTSGCTPTVLEVHDDGRFFRDGKRITEPVWPTDVEKWRDLIDASAVKHDVPPALIAGVMAGESRGKPNVGSPVGALGLMQVMPQYFGGNAGGRLYDPATNINEGVGFLAKLRKKYSGNFLKMLSAYNSGSPQCRVSDPVWGLRQNTGYISKCLGYANDAIDRNFSPFRPSVVPPKPDLTLPPIPVAWPLVGLAVGVVAFLVLDRYTGVSDKLIRTVS